MRLRKLALENWRGVDTREIEFADGVTLIEGPNEIGKSTIVEALRTLFNEMDSSLKKNVKAIQPVGRDVGSRVQAEIQSGDYHFVYEKTYNKAKQTSLDILSPVKKQLTGREAHETVAQILGETVDMALWDALLIDQGEKVAPANLQASSSLASALDAAAGSAAAAQAEDTDLYSAVQAEYEKYYSLKQSKPRFSSVEEEFELARATLDDTAAALSAVEKDLADHELCAADERRLRAELPDLQASVKAHDTTWQEVGTLQEKLAAKRREVDAAQAIAQSAADALNQRGELVSDIDRSEEGWAAESSAQAPLREQTELLKHQAAVAREQIAELNLQVQAARISFQDAEKDEGYLKDLEVLDREKSRLQRLQQISTALASQLEITAEIRVDEAALERFREADRRLAIALGTRDAAATTVAVIAHRKLPLEIDGERLELGAGSVEQRAIASELELRLPQLADIRITPSQSVAELQVQAQEAMAALAELAAHHQVENLEAAVAANQKRTDAQRKIDRLKSQEENILQQSTREEATQTIATLQVRCEEHLAQRKSGLGLPANSAAAAARVEEARAELARVESAREANQQQVHELQREHDELDNRLRLAQQELAGLRAALEEKRQRLEKARAQIPDEALQLRAAQATANVESVSAAADRLQEQFEATSPDAVEARLNNARDVEQRAQQNLQQAQQQLAVLSDRLHHAQADGRFEAFEAAQRNLEMAQLTLDSTRRRAAAAELLWTTLNRHRDSAREAYVRPLKDAIERLGRIVFGADFEVAISDDWTLQTRTLHGKTLPFEDLSVGAREQLGILARLAAAQIVSKDGGVPLIIDDALGFSDPSRLETMGAAIAAAGRHCQIIILTCTPGRFTHVGRAALVKFAAG